jgi:hypothetical protein
MGREDEIRLIAYNIWEETGCVSGNDCQHWYTAETIWEQKQQNPEPAVKSVKSAAAKIKKAPQKKSSKSAASKK